MSTTALRAAATGQVAERPKTILDYLQNKRVTDGLTAVAGRLLQPDRLLRLCVNAVKKAPKLMECDPHTVLGAMMTSAALGLEPNTVQQQAFLIPYKKRAKIGNNWVDVYECQFQIGARGFITLGYRSPDVLKWEARAIHKGDHWKEMAGSRTLVEHSVALEGRGDLIGAFSHVLLDGGAEVCCVLPLDELYKIRSRSETYRALTSKLDAAQNEADKQKAEKGLGETPWVMWIDDMAAKSAIKKHGKQLPIAVGESLASAAEIDSQADRGVLDLSAMTDPDLVRAVVSDEEAPPALENQPTEGIEMSTEGYGSTRRQQQAEPAKQKAAPLARAVRRQSEPPADAKQAQAAAPTANDFIKQLDEAADTGAALEVLAKARNAGMAPDQLKLVEDGFRMAWQAE